MTKTRVLVVDDEADARELITLVLSQAGYEVDEAADGFAALSKVSRYRPDVVLTDLRMPGMNGVDLARADPARARLRTGHHRNRPRDVGSVHVGGVLRRGHCLIKPLDIEELVLDD